jgi:hypothetical protein
VNGISSWNKVSAGKTIYLPTTTAPVSGTSCYAVMTYTVAKGDTAYSICQNYGTSYSAVQSVMSKLNSSANLSSIKAGSTLLVPVPTVITSTTTSSSSSTTTTTTGTTTTGTTTTGTTTSGTTTTGTSSTNSTTKTYTLSTGTVTDGSVSFTVNGKTVTSAAAGAKVHITVTPGSYKALSSLTMTRADGSTAPTISDGEFTMPASNVTVSATFSSGRYIGTSSSGGTVQLTLNGVEVSHAVKGAKVKVNVTPKDGYEISTISVVNTSTGSVVESNVANGSTFTMPDATVMVKVTYKTSDTYAINKVETDEGSLYGSYTLKSDGTVISSAIAGTKVLIDVSPADRYEVKEITVTTVDTNRAVTVKDNYFTMPTEAVNVKVTYGPIDDGDEYFNITVTKPTTGWASAVSDNDDKTTAKAGDTITVKLYGADGYEPVKYTVTANGTTITREYTSETESDTFNMPSGDVTVTPYFAPKAATLTAINTSDNSIGNVTVSVDGTDVAALAAKDESASIDKPTVAIQSKLTVTVELKKAGYTVDSIKLQSEDGETAYLTVQSGSSATVPVSMREKNFVVYVTYKADSIKLSKVDAGYYTGTLTIEKKLADGTYKAIKAGDTVNTGDTLRVTATEMPGYTIALNAVYKDANSKEQTKAFTDKGDNVYTIKVPAYDFSIAVALDFASQG